jgi:hypothetical protein
MKKQTAIQVFDDKKVRSLWDAEQEKWYFSIVDTVTVLTESVDPTAYWRKLKQRLKEEGNETVTNCHGLKMQALDGKMQAVNPTNFEDSKKVAQQGGNVAKVALQELEARTGKKVVSSLNAQSVLQIKKNVMTLKNPPLSINPLLAHFFSDYTKFQERRTQLIQSKKQASLSNLYPIEPCLYRRQTVPIRCSH